MRIVQPTISLPSFSDYGRLCDTVDLIRKGEQQVTGNVNDYILNDFKTFCWHTMLADAENIETYASYDEYVIDVLCAIHTKAFDIFCKEYLTEVGA